MRTNNSFRNYFFRVLLPSTSLSSIFDATLDISIENGSTEIRNLGCWVRSANATYVLCRSPTVSKLLYHLDRTIKTSRAYKHEYHILKYFSRPRITDAIRWVLKKFQ